MALRLAVSFLFFAVPVGLCLFFFYQIAKSLKNMLSHQARNQQVTRAFAFTFLFWLAFWTRKTVFGLLELVNYDQWFTRRLSSYAFVETHHKFWNNLVGSISLLYSTVTPITFIILLRSVQKPFINLLNWVKWKCLCKRQ